MKDIRVVNFQEIEKKVDLGQVFRHIFVDKFYHI